MQVGNVVLFLSPLHPGSLEVVKPSWVEILRNHDETRHYFTVRFDGQERVRQGYAVLVQVRRLCWRMTADSPVISWVLLCPRVVLPNTKAEHVWFGLRFVLLIKPL